MPLLSSFYGIAIKMYYNDHEPPHFHAIFAEHEVLVRLTDGVVLRGDLPRSPSVSSSSGALFTRPSCASPGAGHARARQLLGSCR